MTVDVVDLREFYATPLGKQAMRSIARGMRRIGGLPEDIDVAGLGYAIPVFESLDFPGDKCIVLMPAQQGAIPWPTEEANRTALVDEDGLPLATASVQCVVALHVLENARDTAHLMEEIWRVLVPEGKLILIATNRRGIWARFEHTPFGNGRPFSRGQLAEALRKAKLTPTRWDGCLNFPPIRSRWMQRLYPLIGKMGRRAWPIFCGAHIVVANKRLYHAVPNQVKARERARAPKLAAQGARQSARTGSTSHPGTGP